jgi:hypothetical protein
MRISPGRVAASVAAPVLLLALGTGSAAGLSSGTTAAAGQARPAAAAATARFEPVSASFTSYRAGYVLGTRGHTRLPGAAYLVRTINGGGTWTAVAAPNVRLVDPSAPAPGTAVSAVRFADANNGWLFNPALWATHDGGRHWRQLSLPGNARAMAASSGVAFASVTPPGGGSTRLYTSKVGTDRWTLVPGVVPAGALTFYGRAGWAGLPPNLWATTDLRHWHKLPAFHCPPILGARSTPSSLAAGTATRVLLLCTGNGAAGSLGKRVFASANGGRTFGLVGPAPLYGSSVNTLAIPPGRPQVVTLATASGASMLDRSVNGGKTWRTVQYNDGGIGWRDMRYASPTVGWLVHGGDPGSVDHHGLMRTVNAGATWYTVAIP